MPPRPPSRSSGRWAARSGLSVLGAVLANRVKDGIAEGLLTMGVKTSGSSAGASLDLDALPAPIAHLVRTTYADATATSS